MAKVIANQRGYFGRQIREEGDAFFIDDEIMSDPLRRPHWVDLADGEPEPAAPEPAPAPKRAAPKAKSETVAAPEPVPFADAPEPVRVENEANTLTGATQPDWVPAGEI